MAARTVGLHQPLGDRGFDDGRRQPGDRPDAESDPAPEQTLAEQLPSPRQVGGERALGDAELLGRLAPRFPLQLAGHQRGPIALRQAIQLLVRVRPVKYIYKAA